MTRTREHAVRWVFLALVAAAVTACHDDSSGPAAQINVPNVVGDTQAVATTAITGAGLTVGTVTQRGERFFRRPRRLHWSGIRVSSQCRR
jgi:hypothetical protein